MKFFPKTRARIRNAYNVCKEVALEILGDVFYPIAAAIIVGICILTYYIVLAAQ